LEQHPHINSTLSIHAPRAKMSLAYIVRTFPRLTESFIAQEITALEDRGYHIEIWALEKPKDMTVHPVHRLVRADVTYLPARAYQNMSRLVKAFFHAVRHTDYQPTFRAWLKDFNRDPTRLRIRALAQALILARELAPHITHLHAHHLNLPASVAHYTAMLTKRTWSFSGHAKDIWLTPEWDKREKLASSMGSTASTAIGVGHLQALAPTADRVKLAYHGLDLQRFTPASNVRPRHDGSDPHGAVRILSVGWASERKGYDDLIRALASLPKDIHWQFAHVGEGRLLEPLKEMARKGGVLNRMAFMGALTHPKIIDLMRAADMFVLPCKEAANGDRDSLPNVLFEAASQHLAIISTNFSAIPEFIRNGIEGYLVPPGDWLSLSNTLNMLIRDPERRSTLGHAALNRLTQKFSSNGGIDVLDQLFQQVLNPKSESIANALPDPE